MLKRKEIIEKKLIPCHVVVKSVGNMPIFSKEDDCLRFIFQMYAANTGKPGLNLHRKDINQAGTMLLEGREISEDLVEKNHNYLVNILSFSLVRDHAHFILLSNQEGGISKFINKLNLGFAKYYNLKNNRTGIIFDKPFKITVIENEEQLRNLVWYVNIKSSLEVAARVEEYKFSSFLDLFENRKSKITMPKETLKYVGINFEKISQEIKNVDFKSHIFLE
jgi:Transposase IS200 like